ncbi:VWA domain-containing protein, partial [Sphingomonas sp.]|uniref:VWA domain-containing protein n=1 Tax=Sphingomonas sp. TaxID=28214 RepID=UPI0035BC71B3
MSEGGDPFADAMLAARLCAIDPGLGGMVLRGGGDLRDAVIDVLRGDLREDAPLRRVPPHVDDEALLGGLDLAATLARGVAVRRAGLLAGADGGVVVMPMAERVSDATAARIASVMDVGEVEAAAARFVLMALDDGVEPDERAPAALLERVAFHIDLSRSFPVGGGGPWATPRVEGQPQAGQPVELPLHHQLSAGGAPPRAGEECSVEHLTALVATAAALGVDSARASLFALCTARAAATLAGRSAIADEDIALAARLVLAPRATRIPAPADAESEPPPPPPPEDHDGGDEERGDPAPLDDIVLAAALAALPKDVLAQIAAGGGSRKAVRAHGGGERRKSNARGRPLGVRAGLPGGGRRLALIDTLRTAAPWQRLRGGEPGRVRIRRDDLRVRRFETRAQAVTIFAVDASGSSALARLAEAKGAVELLLAQAYVTRAEVALLAFRVVGAEVLLPPTRSLTRARRALAELPGGGGTPLAAGLEAARLLAEAARARG